MMESFTQIHDGKDLLFRICFQQVINQGKGVCLRHIGRIELTFPSHHLLQEEKHSNLNDCSYAHCNASRAHARQKQCTMTPREKTHFKGTPQSIVPWKARGPW